MARFKKFLHLSGNLSSKALEKLSPILGKASAVTDSTKRHFSEEIVPFAAKTVNETVADIRSKYGPKAEEAFRFALEQAAERNPGEKASTIIGGSVGAGIGYAIGGGIGVVGFFGGIGIPWYIVLAISMAFAGNRIGVGLDKKEIEEKKRAQDDRYQALMMKYQEAIEAKKKPDPNKIIPINTPAEHHMLLKRALSNAEQQVIILCGWVTDYVVDREFKELLSSALDRGVNVFIGYGYTTAGKAKPPSHSQRNAEQHLKDLHEWCAQHDPKGILVVKKFPNHAKVLIRDEEYAVMGSFNWLSNAGRSKNAERSWVVKDRKFVRQEAEVIINQFTSMIDKRDFLKMFYPWSRH